jgi:phosphoribosylglycinamide formyltransferase 1
MSGAEPLPFVVLASGRGSNAQVLFEHALRHPDRFRPLALISDQAGAPVLDVAARLGIPRHVVKHKDEAAMLELLDKLKPRWALLAGYKRIVGSSFLEFFRDKGFFRVLNVHPSLLPAYPGLGGFERAFRDGVKLSGVTVHLVDAGLDTGLPVLQEAFAREESDSLESFSAKGHALEHKLFPQALDLIAAGKMQVRETDQGRWFSTKGRT